MTGPEVERKFDAEFARDDLGQRRLAEARGADEQHVVERLAPGARGLDEHAEVPARRFLAGEVGERQRANRGLGVVVALLGSDEAAGRRRQTRVRGVVRCRLVIR